MPDSKLDEIEHNISNDDEGIVEVIDYWVKDKTIRQPWRQLIWALDWINETQAADKIMEVPKPFSYHNGKYIIKFKDTIM